MQNSLDATKVVTSTLQHLQRRHQQIAMVYGALCYSFVLVWGNGLLPESGRWFKSTSVLKEQSLAFFRGTLSLGERPEQLTPNMVWSEGGIHQVWGLGVPLWRFGFDVAAKLIGLAACPDVLVLFASLVIFTLITTRGWIRLDGPSLEPTPWPMRRMHDALPVCVILFFPPFLALLRTRFEVYEEVIAYGYLYGIILGCCVMRAIHGMSFVSALFLGALAGFGGLIRPTLGAYGLAALLTILLFRSGRQLCTARFASLLAKRNLWGCAFGFLIVSAGLYIANAIRFGDGFEFGHRLNLRYHIGSLYATRFDHEYSSSTTAEASIELFGLLFAPHAYNHGEPYREKLFKFQSPKTRCRELYLPTFYGACVPMLAGGLLVGVYLGRRLIRRAATQREIAMAALVVYSVSAAIALAAFYLRVGVISSRYMLDFMPAFAILCTIAASVLFQDARLRPLSVIAIYGLLAWQIATEKPPHMARDPAQTVSLPQRESLRNASAVPVIGMYNAPQEAHDSGIPFNGVGWLNNSKLLAPCSIFFVADPETINIRLEYIGAGEMPISDVRVKMGLELLHGAVTERTTNTVNLKWRMPEERSFPNGVQTLFIAAAPKENMLRAETFWRLSQISWKETQR